MGPIVVDIDPIILHIGQFSVRWYGLAIASGILAGFFIAGREARRKGISPDDIYSVGLWAVLAGLVGSRIFHVVDHLDYYLANPISAFNIQDGGLAILGGILFGSVAGALYARYRGLPVGKVADAIAPGIILGQAIGRIGCTINGDAVGVPTNVPWGFIYVHPDAMAPSLGMAFQPTMLYEMFWDLLVFGVLWWARGRVKVDGLLFMIYLSLYSIGKFVISFWRQEAIFLFGLQEAQVVSLATIAFAVLVGLLLTSRPQKQTIRS